MKFKSLLMSLLTVGLLLSACSNGEKTKPSGESDIPESPTTHEHTWGDPTYVWTNDYSSCTATRVCLKDAEHKESETKDSVYTVLVEPGCESEGSAKYTVTFENTVFVTQTHEVTLDQKGHTWETPTYEWNADYSECTATRVCSKDSNHVQTETKDSVYEVVTPETVDTDGEGQYVAEFTNTAFVKQTYSVTIPKDKYAQKPHLSANGKTITYGLYPQTNVNDSSLLAALNSLTKTETNGWYLYEDTYYAKVSATPKETDYFFNNGTAISSGETYWFKCEPISWNVLSSNDDEYCIVSSVLLDAKRYCESGSTYNTIDGVNYYKNNYEHSDVRSWLNTDFYDSAFALNKEYIQTTEIDNSAKTTDNTNNTYESGNTEDKVFLLSYQDYLSSSYGFSSETGANDVRCSKTTDWARARGAYSRVSTDSFQNNGYYWTRSPDSESNFRACYVGYGGGFNKADTNLTYVSVRPAITIRR